MATKVYVETSVLSYLTSRASRDKIISAHQSITKDWWKTEAKNYELCVSEIVLREAAKGDMEQAQRRMKETEKCMLLPLTDEALRIAEHCMRKRILPTKASEDLLHISVATTHRVDFVVSWNLAHIANAVLQKQLAAIVKDLNYELPILCTPLELFGREK